MSGNVIFVARCFTKVYGLRLNYHQFAQQLPSLKCLKYQFFEKFYQRDFFMLIFDIL